MIIGHQKQREYLKSIAKSGKVPHALIFSGQEKLGKKTIALEFISLLFNQDCAKHPDLIFIEPTESEIQIAQIRELNWKIALKSYSAPFKAAILDQSHLMNIEAQNCFLKTLEEPKGKSVLILIAEYPERLLPTILSRCQIIKFYPVEKKEIENYLKGQGIKEEESKIITQISQGKPGMVMDFLADPQKKEERQKLIGDLIKLINSHLSFRFQYAKTLSEEANLGDILNIWLVFFREMLISKLNGNDKFPKYSFQKINYPVHEGTGYPFGQVCFGDSISANITAGYSVAKIKNILNKIQNIIYLISTTNVNSKLALEMIMLEL
jgi:DNA polymerase III subunit delta'